MALYEFECNNGHRTEKLCSSRDIQTIPCPECGKIASRLISAPASIRVTEAVHTDSGIPSGVHNKLEDKNRNKYAEVLRRQGGKQILPEDM